MLSAEEMEHMVAKIYSLDKGSSHRSWSPWREQSAGELGYCWAKIKVDGGNLIDNEMSRMGLMLCQAVKIFPTFTVW